MEHLRSDRIHDHHLVRLCSFSKNAEAVVLGTEDDIFLATLMKELDKQRPQNSFHRGICNIPLAIISFMVAMVPIVFIISGEVIGSWVQALFFTVSVVVGSVPEMLPVIISVNLAQGAFFS